MLFRSHHPDLVFLDVQMPGLDGFAVIKRIKEQSEARARIHPGSEQEPLPQIVFATAYDQYAVRAFDVNAVDYLLKPFDEERLRQSVERARERWAAKSQGTFSRQLQALLEATKESWPERFVVRNGECFEFVPVDSLDWVESANNYVQLHCGSKTHLMLETLSGLEKKLDPRKFVRIHSGRIVNVSRIRAAHVMMNGVYELELHGGLRLATGRQFRDAVQSLIRK